MSKSNHSSNEDLEEEDAPDHDSNSNSKVKAASLAKEDDLLKSKEVKPAMTTTGMTKQHSKIITTTTCSKDRDATSKQSLNELAEHSIEDLPDDGQSQEQDDQANVPGAYHVSHPDATQEDNWWDDTDSTIVIGDDTTGSAYNVLVDPPPLPPLDEEVALPGMLVEDDDDDEDGDGDSSRADADVESSSQLAVVALRRTGSTNDHVRISRQHPQGELIEGVKVKDDGDLRGQDRASSKLALAGILVLSLIVIFLIMGLAGVFQKSSSLQPGNEHEPLSIHVVPVEPQAYRMTNIEQIQDDGHLICSYPEFIGVMYKDENGQYAGFFAAFCYAVAAALGVDVLFVPPSDMNGTDPPFSTNGITMALEVTKPFSFTVPISYAGLQMAGDPTIIEQCVDKGLLHTGEICSSLRVCLHFDSKNHYEALSKLMPERYFVPIDMEHNATTFAGLIDGSCNVLAQDSFFLAPIFAQMNGYHGPYAISQTIFIKENVALRTSSDDPEFQDLLNSIVQALFVAEKLNITKDTAHLFPLTTAWGDGNQDMFQNVIRAVGNYADVYRHLEDLIPRIPFNGINQGDTGLLMAHPRGDLLQKRQGPLDPTMQQILDRGVLRCGIRMNRNGFATRTREVSSHGVNTTAYAGMDVDYCHALAASLFQGDASAVEFSELTNATEGFQLLAQNKLDVLAGAPWTLQNDVREPTTGLGFAFSQPYFYGYSEKEDALCLATLQGAGDRHDWLSFVYWTVAGTFLAEEMYLNKSTSNQMPLVQLFGEELIRMFRDSILTVGSSADMYGRNLESIIPRAGRNMLNREPQLGPQHYAPIPGFS
ncbi:extracellular solute-binding protein [Seminavis robusta]|uniref:Extracellular solute-binding protein n=1 Tax=Seminavis robusta TaxID=568900 RepID=A0A9N8DVC0_9STRA|nr:extracellular solute-binding protein [Seminavis robusta]|eukprot:Sro303_g112390.1 extracellular solute-binding protein (821) ;mRNA; f:29767-32504